MYRKVIFLDIDGVLNSVIYDRERGEDDGNIDRSRLPLLKRIIDETGAEVVLSTSWRRHWDRSPEKRDELGDELDKIFGEFGITISGKTPLLGERAHEISAWLTEHPEVCAFAVIDDIFAGWGELSDHVVKTNARIGRGLEEKHVEAAVRILTEI